ncbi:MAG: helix-hairpin-helix domain-containing protein [Sediminibacterium sp. Gen4]|jgi:DNA uptake protein ComE-like DNA-binding protein|uniref:ComEA family DNA-binding protein n=1 Tax=unclassified Sediminibacterium TaxID=2635961 RepID=UPI0015BBC1C1|nr:MULTISPECIES: helix-hairpin-helix domain-containing protein [unclassified Sediminibacterium]MBW0162756.1 helix-hairpin-helix domain-containing protein [Sediminibacterium sp.]MBW0164877.1 helix-hairpin-helix domain-containing protein [Sediminibacterium sp.]NWK65683.1 helix-hairpin-helix domain-containing protein [Sediminibacterium sp. Gen4]
MQKKFRAYDQFSKKERIGILAACILAVVLLILPYLIPPKPLPDVSIMTKEGAKWKEMLSRELVATATHSINTPMYPFDPNLIDETEWQRMGVPITVAKRISNYLSKGGQFRKAEDLRKIWGMPPSLASRLIPYVSIKQREKIFGKTKQSIQPIDINTADVEAWKSLPGIGNVLAERIIKYRERSDGFASKEELRSVFGLSDSLLTQLDPYLQVHASTQQKISLNRASAYQMVIKTGIPAELATVIVRWRQENGLFTEIEELLAIPGFKPEWIDRFKALFYIE